MLPPSAPVTSSTSPGRAPLRVSGPRAVVRPIAVTEIASGPSHVFVSPPAIATSKPLRQRQHARGTSPMASSEARPSRGNTSDTTAATGSAAIAARSLRLTPSALCPTCSGVDLAEPKVDLVGDRVGRHDHVAAGAPSAARPRRRRCPGADGGWAADARRASR